MTRFDSFIYGLWSSQSHGEAEQEVSLLQISCKSERKCIMVKKKGERKENLPALAVLELTNTVTKQPALFQTSI